MKSCLQLEWFTLTIVFIFFLSQKSDAASIDDKNLSCYQCIRTKNDECSKEELLPCPSVSDRCVTQISKDAEKGFQIKRECGLGPCGFNDAMVNKGLGWDKCDRSKDEYFCLFCCRDSGCNKNFGTFLYPKPVLLAIILLIVIVNVFRNFQPPYFPKND